MMTWDALEKGKRRKNLSCMKRGDGFSPFFTQLKIFFSFSFSYKYLQCSSTLISFFYVDDMQTLKLNSEQEQLEQAMVLSFYLVTTYSHIMIMTNGKISRLSAYNSKISTSLS